MREGEQQEKARSVIRGSRKGGEPRGRGTPWVLVLLWALGVTGTAFAADEIHWTITGQTSVTFDWRGSLSENTLSFGTAPGVYTNSVPAVQSLLPNSSPGPFWEARLTGLQENTLYFYKIGDGPEHAFRTPPPRGTSDFWFAEEADIGSTLRHAAVGPTQGQIAANHPDLPGDDRPRFVLVPGDLTYADQSGNPADVDQHFNDVMAWSQDAAYMVIWGNHDWDPSPLTVDNLQNYKGRFDFGLNSQTSPCGLELPGGPGEDWYWFDYGNVRFIAYPEPYPTTPTCTTGTLTDWKAKVEPIMAAAEADPAITFIVTFGHRPAYSSGADHPADGNTGVAPRLRDLKTDQLGRTKSKYVLNIAAHAHHYERTCAIKRNPTTGLDECTTPQEGLVHIVGAGGGATSGGLTLPPPPSWSVFRMNHLAHLRIRVTADKIEGWAICGPPGAEATDSCAENTVIDWWAILAPGPGDRTPPGRPQNLRLANP